MQRLIGLDFGTTNSVIAIPDAAGRVTAARFGAAETFRTVLCFWTEAQAGGTSVLRHAAGPEAVRAYLEDAEDSRLVLSMKSFLAQRSFTETRVFGRPMTLERLVALFLRDLLGAAGLDPREVTAVVGRPVRFVGETAEDALGERRLRAALAEVGVARVELALEPEAAGHRFARTLEGPARVLVGDFGGGTSDFSLLRFEPGARGGRVVPLGHAGVGIAGDGFDRRIIDNVVSPALGRGDSYTVMGKSLPVPPEYFTAFARWHQLPLMRAPRTLRAIEEVAAMSEHPERLRALLRLIEDEQGYRLYDSVTALKARLSAVEAATFEFRHADLAISRHVERAEFERWIAPELARLDEAVGRALADAGLAEAEVDRVFLTGGTSFVPAVRRLFERRFGAERLSIGGEFVSVAEGLALIGMERARG